MLKRLGILDFLGLVLIGAVLFSGNTLAGDPGVGWHLRSGEWMALHHQILRFDPFLFTSNGKSWVNNQWLSDLVFWKLFTLGSWPLLHAAVIALVVSVYTVALAPLLLRTVPSPLLSFLVLALCATNGAVQWILRPVLFSVLLFAILYRVIYTIKTDSQPTHVRCFVGLPLLFVVWANLHPGFVMGLGLLGLAAFCELLTRGPRAKTLLGLLLLCATATLINPFGLALHANVLNLVGDKYFMNLNMEWLSPDFHQINFLPLLVVMLVFVLALCSGARRSLTLFDSLVATVFLAGALVSRRYIPFFSVAISVPLLKALASTNLLNTDFVPLKRLLLAFSNISNRELKASVLGGTVFALLALLSFTAWQSRLPFQNPELSAPDKHFPVAAFNAISASGKPGRIFHTPNFGGYITWTLYPKYQAFIDDRNELNTRVPYEQYRIVVNARKGWEKILEDYGFVWIVLEPKDPLGDVLVGRAGYREFFEDERVSVFLRE